MAVRSTDAHLPVPGKLEKLLLGLALALAAYHVLVFLTVALLRVSYPFELEWMEGGMLNEVLQILQGRPLYVSPTVEFVPYVYNPLYFYLAAGLAWVLGPGLFALRLLSLLATLGVLTLIFRFLRREGMARPHAGLACGVLAGCYSLGGWWFDLARTDMVCYLFFLVGLYALRFRRDWPGVILTALCFWLAFLVKQNALPLALPLLLFAVWRDRRRGLALAGLWGGLVAGGVLLLNWLHEGWYLYYTFQVPRRFLLLKDAVSLFLIHDLLPLAPGLAGAGFLLVRFWRRRELERLAFYGLLLAATLGVAWSIRRYDGAFDNSLIPVHLALALVLGLALGEAGRADAPAAADPRRRVVTRRAIGALVCIQLLAGLGNWPAQIPTAADRQAGWRLVASLKAFPGEVYPVHCSYLAALAGKRPFANFVGLGDVMRSPDGGQPRLELIRSVREAIRQRRFDALMLNSWGQLDKFQEEIERQYAAGEVFFPDPAEARVFWPKTGMPTRPWGLWVRRANGPSAQVAENK